MRTIDADTSRRWINRLTQASSALRRAATLNPGVAPPADLYAELIQACANVTVVRDILLMHVVTDVAVETTVRETV